MNSRHRWTAYGLTFDSEVPIPEMLPDEGSAPADVRVRVGRVPEHLSGARVVAEHFEASAGEMLLRIDGVGEYLVVGGREIVVAPDPGGSSHEVRVFLLGTCMGALLHQRGALVLHASGVGTDQGAVLFAGPSGSGKSTLLAEMMRRGYDMVVDDVAAVFADGETGVVLEPSYPRTRVWADTAELLGVETEGLQRTRTHMDKFERQLHDRFWDRPGPIRRIYHLAGSRGDELAVIPVPPLAVVPTLVANTYRRVFIDGFDIRAQHFDVATRVARNVAVRQVVRPKDIGRLGELVEMILDDLG